MMNRKIIMYATNNHGYLDVAWCWGPTSDIFERLSAFREQQYKFRQTVVNRTERKKFNILNKGFKQRNYLRSTRSKDEVIKPIIEVIL